MNLRFLPNFNAKVVSLSQECLLPVVLHAWLEHFKSWRERLYQLFIFCSTGDPMLFHCYFSSTKDWTTD